MTQLEFPAFVTNCEEVPLLALARINFADESRKEGVIQRWLSTVAVIYSGIETIKLVFPRNNADYCASTHDGTAVRRRLKVKIPRRLRNHHN